MRNALSRFLSSMSRGELASAEVLQLFKSDRLCLRWSPDYGTTAEHITLERFNLEAPGGLRAMRERRTQYRDQIAKAQRSRSINTIGH